MAIARILDSLGTGIAGVVKRLGPVSHASRHPVAGVEIFGNRSWKELSDHGQEEKMDTKLRNDYGTT